MLSAPIVLVGVLRSRFGIEAVCQDGSGMNGESKRRKFRSWHLKNGRGRLGHDAKQIPFPWKGKKLSLGSFRLGHFIGSYPEGDFRPTEDAGPKKLVVNG